MLSYLVIIRQVILFISKIIYIVSAIYYLYNYQIYSLSIKLPFIGDLFLVKKVVETIEATGMYAIIFPVAVVILSFFYKESKALQIISGFLAISGTIFSFSHALSHGVLEEHFKFGFITVYHQVSYQTKWALFEILLNQKVALMQATSSDPNLFKTLVEEIYQKNTNNYATLIKAMSKDNVPTFASTVAENINALVKIKLKSLTEISAPVTSTNAGGFFRSLFSWSTLGKIVGIGVVIGGSYYLYSKLKQNVELTKNVSEEGGKLNSEVTTTGVLSQEGVHQIRDANERVKELAELSVEQKQVITDIATKVNGHADDIDKLNSAIREIKQGTINNPSIQNISTQSDVLLERLADLGMTNTASINEHILKSKDELEALRSGFDIKLSTMQDALENQVKALQTKLDQNVKATHGFTDESTLRKLISKEVEYFGDNAKRIFGAQNRENIGELRTRLTAIEDTLPSIKQNLSKITKDKDIDYLEVTSKIQKIEKDVKFYRDGQLNDAKERSLGAAAVENLQYTQENYQSNLSSALDSHKLNLSNALDTHKSEFEVRCAFFEQSVKEAKEQYAKHERALEDLNEKVMLYLNKPAIEDASTQTELTNSTTSAQTEPTNSITSTQAELHSEHSHLALQRFFGTKAYKKLKIEDSETRMEKILDARIDKKFDPKLDALEKKLSGTATTTTSSDTNANVSKIHQVITNFSKTFAMGAQMHKEMQHVQEEHKDASHEHSNQVD
jgi:hypothetical protein